MSLLSVEGLSKRFGGLTALDEVSFTVGEGTIVGLIGPNGAGKSTALSVIAGEQPATSGRIRFDGRDITSAPAHSTTAAGIARTFQQTRPFGSMTAREMLTTAAFLRHRRRRAAHCVADQTLQLLGIEQYAQRTAMALPAPIRRLLELGRALATEPRLVLLDEVLAGLTDEETATTGRIIRDMSATGTSVLLVDHVLDVVLDLCTDMVVLHHGTVIFTGPPDEARTDGRVRDVYLGA